MSMDTTNQTTIAAPAEDRHSIEDIRAVVLIEKTAPVDQQGMASGPPSVISEDVQQRGWRCLPCEVDFHQWGAVEAHLKEPKRTNTRTDQELSELDDGSR